MYRFEVSEVDGDIAIHIFVIQPIVSQIYGWGDAIDVGRSICCLDNWDRLFIKQRVDLLLVNSLVALDIPC